jgi:hypothetical protein
MLESLQSNCQRVSFAQHHHLLVCHIPYTELTFFMQKEVFFYVVMEWLMMCEEG